MLSNFHPLQVDNCDINLRLVVDEDYNGKLGLKGLIKRTKRVIYKSGQGPIPCISKRSAHLT